MLPHRRAALLETSGTGAECDPVVPNLALSFQRLEGLPDGRIPDRRCVGVVQLKYVDVRRAQAFQGPFQRLPDPRRREVGARRRASDFARDNNEFPLVAEGLSDQTLSLTVSVRRGDIEVVNPRVVGFV